MSNVVAEGGIESESDGCKNGSMEGKSGIG